MRRLIALDIRQLVRERLALVILAVALAACGLAFVNGRATLADQIDGRTASRGEDAASAKAFRDGLAKPASPADAILRAVRISLPVAAPLPPLADFSIGRAAFENYSTIVRLRTRPDTLFKRTQPDNPEMLARGSFDLGFVVVGLAPLLLIALGHGLFTADRDSGAARLILAQGGMPTRLLLARSVPRLAIVVLPILLTAAALLLAGPRLAGRSEAAAQWLLIAGLLIAFWWAVILLVNGFRISAETAALTLVGLWTLLTLILPVLISAGAQLAYPPPSRFAEIAAARAAEVGSTSTYENDHPDLASEDFAGRLASVRKSYAIGVAIDRAVAPVTARFDRRLAEQQRATDAARYLSPALVAADALAAAAGTDNGAKVAFRRSTADYLTRVKASLGQTIEAGRPLTASDYEALPRFRMVAASAAPVPATTFLVALTLGIVILAARRFNRLRPD